MDIIQCDIKFTLLLEKIMMKPCTVQNKQEIDGSCRKVDGGRGVGYIA